MSKNQLIKSNNIFIMPIIGLLACGDPITEETKTETGHSTTTATTETSPHTGSKTTVNELFEFSGQAPKNVLVLSIDTWRKDYFNKYKAEEGMDLTPFLDSILDQSVVLDKHQSCSSWTYPAMACALSGKDPFSLGYMPPATPVLDPMPEDEDFLAQILHDNGYQTRLVSANPFVCSLNIGEEYDEVDCLIGVEFFIETARFTIESGLEALQSMKEKEDPWFLHLHFMDMHTPYNPPDEYLDALDELEPLVFVDVNFATDDTNTLNNLIYGLNGKQTGLFMSHVKERYKAEVRYFDDQLALLFDQMEKSGDLDDTLVVILSDHGEQFLEDNIIGHSASLHSYEADVMAMFYAKTLQAKSWKSRTTHQDLVPTTLSLLGVKTDNDFSGSVVGTSGDGLTRFAYLLKPTTFEISATNGDHRLHYDWGQGAKTLYNLVDDPNEMTDLYDSKDPVVISIWEDLSVELKRIAPLVEIAGPVDAHP